MYSFFLKIYLKWSYQKKEARRASKEQECEEKWEERERECTNLHINPYDEMCVQSAYMGFSFEIHRNYTRWLQSICGMYVYVLRLFRRYLKTSLSELRCCCCHHIQWASLYRTKMAIDAFIRHKYRSSSVVLAICICPQWNLSFPCTCIRRNSKSLL